MEVPREEENQGGGVLSGKTEGIWMSKGGVGGQEREKKTTEEWCRNQMGREKPDKP